MHHSLDVDQTLDAGVRLQQSGSWLEAEVLYRQILAVDPKNLDALNLLGLIAQSTGRYAEALSLVDEALEIDSEFAEGLANKARVMELLGRPEDARTASRRAVDLDPALGEGWQQLGLANVRLGYGPEAMDAFRNAESLLPDSIEVQAGLAEAAKLVSDHATVADALQIVLAARPDDVNALIDLGVAFTELIRPHDALPILRRALELSPGNSIALFALAVAMHRQRYDPAELESLCNQLLAFDSGNADVLMMLAASQTWLGKFDEAKAVYAKVLEAEPEHQDAQARLATLIADEGGSQDLSALKTRMEDEQLSSLSRSAAGHTLGRNLERAGDYDGAFSAFAEANRITNEALRQAGQEFQPGNLQEYVDWALASFSKSTFLGQHACSNPSDLPVFIVGMPRSGTSLVEQIVSSHPDIFGAGERRDITDLFSVISLDKRSYVPELWQPALARFQTDQLISTLRTLGGCASRFVNKIPDNIFFLGQIALLFPNARIVICQRDLRDVCLSCFTNHFVEELPWANDLDDCGVRAVAVERLRNHWRSVLPIRMLEVSYETLVGNFEPETRRLIDFLGLDWSPACLDFKSNRKAVSTASYWQVRQPLYDSSIGRWRRFEPHLGPLLKRLSAIVSD